MRLDLKVLTQQEKVLDLYHGEILEVNFWVEANDEGDPKNNVTYRDIIYTLSNPFKDEKRNYTRLNLDLEI